MSWSFHQLKAIDIINISVDFWDQKIIAPVQIMVQIIALIRQLYDDHQGHKCMYFSDHAWRSLQGKLDGELLSDYIGRLVVCKAVKVYFNCKQTLEKYFTYYIFFFPRKVLHILSIPILRNHIKHHCQPDLFSQIRFGICQLCL